MKTRSLILSLSLILAVNVGKALNPAKVYSHLPLEIKEVLTDELSNPEVDFMQSMYGHIWIEFHLDGNGEIHITSLSADDLALGAFVEDVLQELPRISKNCPIGKSYRVKARIAYNK